MAVRKGPRPSRAAGRLALGLLAIACCVCALSIGAELPSEAILATDGLAAQALVQHHGHTGDLRAAAAAARAAPPPPRAAPTLGYVTPWNSRGYDFAKRCACRLDYVSPVWYQLRAAGGELQLTGGHDVDAGWVAAVRAGCAASSEPALSSNHSTRIVPRVIFEVQGQEVLEAFKRPQAVANLLAAEAERHGFDGWVFEGWALWSAMGITRHPQLREAALALLRQVASQLSAAKRRLLLAVPPLVPAPGRPAQLTAEDAEELLALSDGLSVMTYDHSSPQQPGPNAPLPWWEQNADAFADVADRLPDRPRHKVLLGLNFYGYEYSFKGKQLQKADAVLASRLLEVLGQHAGPEAGGRSGGGDEGDEPEQPAAQQQCSSSSEGGGAGSCAADAAPSASSSGGLRIQWLDESREHLFRWREPPAGGSGSGGGGGKKKKKKGGLQHLLYFPTPAALAERLAAAGARGMGAAVWELGQGMDAFCGLL